MKPILAVLALVFTSTLFAQEPGRRPVRGPRPQGTEQEAPRPRDERMLPPRARMRGERTRTDAEQERGPGGARRPGHGRPPHGGRGRGPGSVGPGNRPRGGMERDRAVAPRELPRAPARAFARGVRPDGATDIRAKLMERMQELRGRGQKNRMDLPMLAKRRMEMMQRLRALESRRMRGGREV